MMRIFMTCTAYRILLGLIRWVGQVARVGEMRNVYCILVGKPEGKRPVWRLRRICKCEVKIDIRK